jgi:hypothetical protein
MTFERVSIAVSRESLRGTSASFVQPSICVSEHEHYQKDVFDPFNIPNNYCLVDSDMLEPPIIHILPLAEMNRTPLKTVKY